MAPCPIALGFAVSAVVVLTSAAVAARNFPSLIGRTGPAA